MPINRYKFEVTCQVEVLAENDEQAKTLAEESVLTGVGGEVSINNIDLERTEQLSPKRPPPAS